MVTVKQLLFSYRPGIIFGGIIGFLVESYIRTVTFENVSFLKFMEFNVQFKGFPIILLFSALGVFIQYYFKWK